jgi:hypothetical protein
MTQAVVDAVASSGSRARRSLRVIVADGAGNRRTLTRQIRLRL